MATASRQSTSHPISYYWNVVKDMDNRQKLELVTMLIESVKPFASTQIIEIPEQEYSDMDKDFYTPEEAYELVMEDIKDIYNL